MLSQRTSSLPARATQLGSELLRLLPIRHFEDDVLLRHNFEFRLGMHGAEMYVSRHA